ncbi:hypothetical protein J6590_100347 [Homalodisca vitripennis]|nr:hypothetical protein J6590_100347 [Homalodisca vitripennis]
MAGLEARESCSGRIWRIGLERSPACRKRRLTGEGGGYSSYFRRCTPRTGCHYPIPVSS